MPARFSCCMSTSVSVCCLFSEFVFGNKRSPPLTLGSMQPVEEEQRVSPCQCAVFLRWHNASELSERNKAFAFWEFFCFCLKHHLKSVSGPLGAEFSFVSPTGLRFGEDPAVVWMDIMEKKCFFCFSLEKQTVCRYEREYSRSSLEEFVGLHVVARRCRMNSLLLSESFARGPMDSRQHKACTTPAAATRTVIILLLTYQDKGFLKKSLNYDDKQ